jgi:hypothetical protein
MTAPDNAAPWWTRNTQPRPKPIPGQLQLVEPTDETFDQWMRRLSAAEGGQAR